MHKSLLSLLAAALVASFPSSAEAGAFSTLVVNSTSAVTPIVVPAHRMLTIVNFLQTSGASESTILLITKGELNTFVYATTQTGNSTSDVGHHAPEGVVIVGPATVVIGLGTNSTALFTYKMQAD